MSIRLTHWAAVLALILGSCGGGATQGPETSWSDLPPGDYGLFLGPNNTLSAFDLPSPFGAVGDGRLKTIGVLYLDLPPAVTALAMDIGVGTGETVVYVLGDDSVLYIVDKENGACSPRGAPFAPALAAINPEFFSMSWVPVRPGLDTLAVMDLNQSRVFTIAAETGQILESGSTPLQYGPASPFYAGESVQSVMSMRYVAEDDEMYFMEKRANDLGDLDPFGSTDVISTYSQAFDSPGFDPAEVHATGTIGESGMPPIPAPTVSFHLDYSARAGCDPWVDILNTYVATRPGAGDTLIPFGLGTYVWNIGPTGAHIWLGYTSEYCRSFVFFRKES